MAATLLPRYPVLGYEGIDPERAAEMLHQKKNAPTPPVDMDVLIMTGAVKPYEKLTVEDKAFPTAMYRVWTDENKMRAMTRAARQMNKNLKDPVDWDELEAYVGPMDSALAKSEADALVLGGQGWAHSMAEARQIHFQAHRDLATDAAVSFNDDKRVLSEKGMAAREVIDDAAPDHITEIPHTPLPPKAAPKGAK